MAHVFRALLNGCSDKIKVFKEGRTGGKVYNYLDAINFKNDQCSSHSAHSVLFHQKSIEVIGRHSSEQVKSIFTGPPSGIASVVYGQRIGDNLEGMEHTPYVNLRELVNYCEEVISKDDNNGIKYLSNLIEIETVSWILIHVEILKEHYDGKSFSVGINARDLVNTISITALYQTAIVSTQCNDEEKRKMITVIGLSISRGCVLAIEELKQLARESHQFVRGLKYTNFGESNVGSMADNSLEILTKVIELTDKNKDVKIYTESKYHRKFVIALLQGLMLDISVGDPDKKGIVVL